MTSRFLTKDELIELTGYSQHSKQRRFLKEHGIKCLGKKGYPRITWGAIENYFLPKQSFRSDEANKATSVKLNTNAFKEKE